MKRTTIQKSLVNKIIPVLKRYGIKKAGIFGSYARGEATKKSDVDIFVKYNGSLLSLVGIEIELKQKLKRKVDLLTYNGISPLLKDRILNEEVKII